MFLLMYTRSDVHKYIFIPNTIVDWNVRPNNIINGCEIAPEQLEHFSNNIWKKNIMKLLAMRGEWVSNDVLP